MAAAWYQLGSSLTSPGLLLYWKTRSVPDGVTKCNTLIVLTPRWASIGSIEKRDVSDSIGTSSSTSSLSCCHITSVSFGSGGARNPAIAES